MRKNKLKLERHKKYIYAAILLVYACFCIMCLPCSASDTRQSTIENLDVPIFQGTPYVEINQNKPFFTEDDMKENAFEIYSVLDQLGRCGTAYANICKEIMPTEKRGKIGMIKPSGWNLVKYDFVDGKYLFNRCHLIGYQLSGENANEKNLITGTRYLNIDGMLPYENMVAEYVKKTGNHVLYRVTPIYQDNNLVASGVLMEGKSVEDGGKGISYCIYAYNNQPGVVINYANGESSQSTNLENELKKAEENGSISVNKTIDTEENNNETAVYILNTNTHKFHSPSCKSVKAIKSKNKKEVIKKRQELIEGGYSPCKQCKP